ncbi:MAG: hypothetical protein AAB377_03135 [Patescibacteria group bacterium]
MKEEKTKLWLTIVFIAAIVIYLVLALLGGNYSRAPESSEFKGPTGVPYIKGPSGPPPGGN